MKKIMSIVIMSLCTWIAFIVPPEVDGEITIGMIPVVILTLTSMYFFLLCLVNSEDKFLD